MNYAVDLNVPPDPKIGRTIGATQARTEIKVEGTLNAFPTHLCSSKSHTSIIETEAAIKGVAGFHRSTVSFQEEATWLR